MAKEDNTQRLLNELISLNATNASLRDTIKDYARTTASTMANTAAATQSISTTTAVLGNFTEIFESVKRIVGDIKGHMLRDKNNEKRINILNTREKNRYVAIAKIFDSILKVSSFSKFLKNKDQIKVDKEIDKKKEIPTESLEKQFNKILKVSNIYTQLSNIHKTILDNEAKKIKNKDQIKVDKEIDKKKEIPTESPEKQFNKILKVSNIYTQLSNIHKTILDNEAKKIKNKDQIKVDKEIDKKKEIPTESPEKHYNVAAAVFNKIMKVSNISTQLSNIHKTILDNEEKKIERQKDLERSKSFTPLDTDGSVQISKVAKKTTKDETKKEEKSNWLTNFLLSIPIIGNLFRVVKGLTTMLISASPVIALLSHFLSNEIGPLQGTIDLFAKYQLRGGKTFADIGELIFEKVKNIIQWPIKFLKEKLPSIFGNFKIPFQKTEKVLTNVAAEGAEGLVKMGAKGGFLAKFLGAGKSGLKFLSKIPVLGGLISLYFAWDRFKKGDYVGGLIELASAVATGTGLGTPISIILGIVQALRDITRTPEEENKFKARKEAAADIINGMHDMVGSFVKWVGDKIGWIGSFIDKVKEFFSISENKIQKLKIPNTAPEIEKMYNQKIAESQEKIGITSMSIGNASAKRYSDEIDNFKKEKQDAINKLEAKPPKVSAPLPKVNAPTTSIESPKNNNQVQIINSIDDTELMDKQNRILGVQTQLLERLVQNTSNSSISSPVSINNDSVNIRQNTSISRDYYLNSTAAVTKLLGGVA